MSNIHWERANASLLGAQNDCKELVSKWKEMLNSIPHDVQFKFFDGTTYCIPNFAKMMTMFLDGTWVLEAPIDSKIYGRQNGDWTEIPEPIGFPDVPDSTTTIMYSRRHFVDSNNTVSKDWVAMPQFYVFTRNVVTEDWNGDNLEIDWNIPESLLTPHIISTMYFTNSDNYTADYWIPAWYVEQGGYAPRIYIEQDGNDNPRKLKVRLSKGNYTYHVIEKIRVIICDIHSVSANN